jgi:hypothetical protein
VLTLVPHRGFKTYAGSGISSSSPGGSFTIPVRGLAAANASVSAYSEDNDLIDKFSDMMDAAAVGDTTVIQECLSQGVDVDASD